MTAIRQKHTKHREDALKHAYQTLSKLHVNCSLQEKDGVSSGNISTRSLYRTLEKVRDHYAAEKVR